MLEAAEAGSLNNREKSGRTVSKHANLKAKHQSSEDAIASKTATTRFKTSAGASAKSTQLPDKPKRLWDEDFRGKPKTEKSAALIAFLEDVYGSYFEEHRDKLRSYIAKHNPRLYRAIEGFGFENLPSHLAMPSLREMVRIRLRRAAAGEYEQMTEPERKSVRGKLLRLERPAPRKS